MLAILLIFIIVYLSFYLGGLPYWLEPSVLFKWNTIIYIVLTVWYLYKFKRKNIICFELFFSFRSIFYNVRIAGISSGSS